MRAGEGTCSLASFWKLLVEFESIHLLSHFIQLTEWSQATHWASWSLRDDPTNSHQHLLVSWSHFLTWNASNSEEAGKRNHDHLRKICNRTQTVRLKCLTLHHRVAVQNPRPPAPLCPARRGSRLTVTCNRKNRKIIKSLKVHPVSELLAPFLMSVCSCIGVCVYFSHIRAGLSLSFPCLSS